jgi:predicted nucleic acid-binding protein
MSRFILDTDALQLLQDGNETVLAHISMKKLKLKVRKMDLRIAATVLEADATDATLVSRNGRDFRQVPGLRIEDWSK